jgi:cytochrome P450
LPQTVSTIHFFFLFMTLHPDIQAKAQAEIDAVVGNSRLPTISDRPHLPYVNALVSELLRLGTVLPQGAPHTVREDDMHEGYFIPKNSIIIANIW